MLRLAKRCIMVGIGLYRDVWIAAIASSTTSLATRTAAICVRFQGRRVRRVYVAMQITFLTRKSALIYRRGLRQRVASLTLNCNGDFAIRAYCHGLVLVGALLVHGWQNVGSWLAECWFMVGRMWVHGWQNVALWLTV